MFSTQEHDTWDETVLIGLIQLLTNGYTYQNLMLHTTKIYEIFSIILSFCFKKIMNNEKEDKHTVKTIYGAKSWFIENANKVANTSVRLFSFGFHWLHLRCPKYLATMNTGSQIHKCSTRWRNTLSSSEFCNWNLSPYMPGSLQLKTVTLNQGRTDTTKQFETPSSL